MNHTCKYFLLGCLAPLFLSACERAASSGLPATAAGPARGPETFRLSKGSLGGMLKLPGELIARQQVDLYAKLPSYVRELYVDIGSKVRQGQLLLRLDAPELNSQLAGAESRLKSQEALYEASNATYNRLLETSRTPGTISGNDLDIAAARRNSDLAQLESARAAYREVHVMKGYLEIRAPFSGVVTARNIHAGAYVGPSGKGSELPALTLQEQQQLRLVVEVPEQAAAFIRDQQTVSFSVQSLPGKIFEARVKRLSGALDRKLRSERIEMDIDNAGGQLLPGMVAEVNLTLAQADSAFLVPLAATVNTDEGFFVIGVKAGKTQRIPVTRGREADGQLEIFGNLQSGDTLITHASEEIRNGTPVLQ